MSEKRPMETATPRSIEEQELMTSKCCCCIPLNIACFVLGYLALLANFYNILIIVGALMINNLMTSVEIIHTEIIHTEDTGSAQVVADLDPVKQIDLDYDGMMLLLNIAWLCWNMYMLVGLHKRQPGPIKLHMTVASIRFILLVLALVTLTGPSSSINYIIISCTEISITGYFLIVYHAYATRLVRSQKARILTIETTTPPQISITDVYYAYPKVLDKQHLVEKEKY